LAEPGFGFGEIQIEIIAFHEGVIDTELFDESTVAACAFVRDNDAVIRAIFGAFAAKTDDSGHDS
jgi:hypothetical protein